MSIQYIPIALPDNHQLPLLVGVWCPASLGQGPVELLVKLLKEMELVPQILENVVQILSHIVIRKKDLQKKFNYFKNKQDEV